MGMDGQGPVDDETDAAERAFEALRAEVAAQRQVLQQVVAALKAQGQRQEVHQGHVMTGQTLQIQAYNPPDFFRTKPEDAAQRARSWLHGISSLSSCGVYIVRSISHPDTYRLGMFANGALRRLVKDHLGKAVVENHVYPNGTRPNSTQIKRPFPPVWFCTLSGATYVATKLAENVLEFTVGEKYVLSEQKSEGSMFTPSSKFDQDLANIAADFKMRLAGCYEQLGITVIVLPDFQQGMDAPV